MIVMGERGDGRAFGPASKSTPAVEAVAAGVGASGGITKSMSRISTEAASWRFPLLAAATREEEKEGIER